MSSEIILKYSEIILCFLLHATVVTCEMNHCSNFRIISIWCDFTCDYGV